MKSELWADVMQKALHITMDSNAAVFCLPSEKKSAQNVQTLDSLGCYLHPWASSMEAAKATIPCLHARVATRETFALSQPASPMLALAVGLKPGHVLYVTCRLIRARCPVWGEQFMIARSGERKRPNMAWEHQAQAGELTWCISGIPPSTECL